MKDKPNNNSGKVCVYYNSACPVCKAGIEYQKRGEPQNLIVWNDIHLDNQSAAHISPDIEKLRKYLHVTDQQGQVSVGIDAFIVIWKNSQKQARLATLFALPIFRPMAKAAYFIFANALYRWNRWKKHW